MQLHKKACPPLLFWFPFLLQSKLVVRKQGRCALKASAGKEFRREILPCFRKMRRVHRAPGRAPLLRNTPVFRGRSVCPPWPRREACLMVFARDALASGPGKAWNVIAFTPTWRKVKVGKIRPASRVGPKPPVESGIHFLYNQRKRPNSRESNPNENIHQPYPGRVPGCPGVEEVDRIGFRRPL